MTNVTEEREVWVNDHWRRRFQFQFTVQYSMLPADNVRNWLLNVDGRFVIPGRQVTRALPITFSYAWELVDGVQTARILWICGSVTLLGLRFATAVIWFQRFKIKRTYVNGWAQ